MKKTPAKNGSITRVTFELPAAAGAGRAEVLGDFNDWSGSSMKRRKDGSFSVTLQLRQGRTYRFRYLIDGERWENDGAADGYAPNEFGSEDSLVSV